MFRFNATNVAWLCGYIAVCGLICWGMARYRDYAYERYGSAKAENNWQTWREEAGKLSMGKGPVKRRQPKSLEPPPLVLMRDHYSACLGISLLLSSCLYLWLMFSVRGALKPVVLYDD